jgi:solute carrier family 25 phosphate transporter 23/24/25/41
VTNPIFNIAATFPLDLVKRRMQLHGAAGSAPIDKLSIAGTSRQILQKEGPRGFYRGIVPEYLKVVPSVGIAFMTYEVLKSLLSSIDGDDEN